MAIKWSSWASLGKPREIEIGRPFAQRNQDGRLEVFAIGAGAIFNIWQVAPNGAWRDGWLSKGNPSSDVGIKSHVVGRNADDRLEIFAVGDDNALWQKWQVAPNNGWSEAWKTLGTPGRDTSLTDKFTVGRNEDGRQEVFAVGSDGNIWQIWQTAPNGGWSDWGKLGKPPFEIRRSDRITVGNNIDGRQELFVIGEDSALWHIWQVTPNGGWSVWESLGKPKDRDFPEPKDRDLSSAGCQVVLGFPKCGEYEDKPLWPTFRDRAYALDRQEEFGYLDCLEVAEVSEDQDAKRPLSLRCGSHRSPLPPGQAELINKVQTCLKEAGYYGGEVDGDFDARSALATVNYQKATFGATHADGIVGPQTGLALLKNSESWLSL